MRQSAQPISESADSEQPPSQTSAEIIEFPAAPEHVDEKPSSIEAAPAAPPPEKPALRPIPKSWTAIIEWHGPFKSGAGREANEEARQRAAGRHQR